MAALERTKRSAAGNRMQALLGQEEEEDEFWSNHADYFADIGSDDDEFDEDNIEGNTDSEDSDIDRDEEQIDSEDESKQAEKDARKEARQAARKQKRQGGYKDPALKQARSAARGGRASARVRGSGAPASASLSVNRQRRTSVEASNAARRAAAAAEKAANQAKASVHPRPKKPVEVALTQHQVLAEAARTEIVNKASLERLMRLEEELRKDTVKQRIVTGPRLKYLSRAVPLQTHERRAAIMAMSVSASLAAPPPAALKPSATKAEQAAHAKLQQTHAQLASKLAMQQTRASVNTYTFTDTAHIPYSAEAEAISETPFRGSRTAAMAPRTGVNAAPAAQPSYLQQPQQQPPPPAPLRCVITKLPAKYLDPLTKLPYATLEAFKQIRTRHKAECAAAAKAKVVGAAKLLVPAAAKGGAGEELGAKAAGAGALAPGSGAGAKRKRLDGLQFGGSPNAAAGAKRQAAASR